MGRSSKSVAGHHGFFLKLIFQRPIDFRDPRSAALSRKNQQTRNPQLEGGEEKEERMARYF